MREIELIGAADSFRKDWVIVLKLWWTLPNAPCPSKLNQTKSFDGRNGRNENHSFWESEKWSTNGSVFKWCSWPSSQINPSHFIWLSCVVTWGLDHPMFWFLGIPLVGICYSWGLELSCEPARSCSLAFGRHPPGLVHPGGPTRRGNRDKGGPFGVGDSSTFETLLWEVANGHWAEENLMKELRLQENQVFFLVFVIANETFWSSCLLKTGCVCLFVHTYPYFRSWDA